MATTTTRIGTLLLILLAALPARAQEGKIISARAGLVTRAEGEALYHCHEKGGGVERLLPGERLHDGDRIFTGRGASVTWALNPDSYMTLSPDSVVRVHDGALERMHFDVERGEVRVVSRALKGGASLVIHAPPGLLTVARPGRYLFRVAEGGETEAAVGGEGELRYKDDEGREVTLKKRMKVNFRKADKKKDGHGT